MKSIYYYYQCKKRLKESDRAIRLMDDENNYMLLAQKEMIQLEMEHHLQCIPTDVVKITISCFALIVAIKFATKYLF